MSRDIPVKETISVCRIVPLAAMIAPVDPVLLGLSQADK